MKGSTPVRRSLRTCHPLDFCLHPSSHALTSLHASLGTVTALGHVSPESPPTSTNPYCVCFSSREEYLGLINGRAANPHTPTETLTSFKDQLRSELSDAFFLLYNGVLGGRGLRASSMKVWRGIGIPSTSSLSKPLLCPSPSFVRPLIGLPRLSGTPRTVHQVRRRKPSEN